MKNKLVAGLAILIWLAACKPTISTTEQVTGAMGDSAMIVSAHPLATKVGLSILKQGGNAIDAAIATQFALAVVYPRAGNIGGGGFALLRSADGEFKALDFREKAPSLAHKDMYLDEQSEVIADMSTLGHKAAGVPGSVAGMWELFLAHGSLDWRELVQPSIDLAFYGFEITEDEAEALNEKQEDFTKANFHKPWVIKEGGWKAGDWVKQPQLAATLSFVRDSGRDGFYTGIVADQIIKEMEAGNGIISYEDLKNYEPVWRTPLRGKYKHYDVFSFPPPSSGGIAVLQMLKGAEQLDLGQYDHNSADYAHVMSEIEKRVFADRAEYLGDPDFVKVPIEELLDSNYNASRFEAISLNRITPSSEISAGLGKLAFESPETTHFSIIDRFGNAVSLTTTLNLNYGCKVWVKGAGFVLNNEMDDFSAKPGTPNFFGLTGNAANAIAPEKRMLSSMTPSMVEENGQLRLVVGSPGGSTIITSVFQTILNVLDHEMSMQEAVNARKIHHQWLPDQIKMEENALSPETFKELESRGFKFEIVDKIGRNDCILVLPDGSFEGGADPRGDDYAEGF